MDDLLTKTKQNLILEHEQDNALLRRCIAAAVGYAERYQNQPPGTYACDDMPVTTEQAVIMLASHFYESRDGSTAGFFADSPQAGQQAWRAVDRLLALDKSWEV